MVTYHRSRRIDATPTPHAGSPRDVDVLVVREERLVERHLVEHGSSVQRGPALVPNTSTGSGSLASTGSPEEPIRGDPEPIDLDPGRVDDVRAVREHHQRSDGSDVARPRPRRPGAARRWHPVATVASLLTQRIHSPVAERMPALTPPAKPVLSSSSITRASGNSVREPSPPTRHVSVVDDDQLLPSPSATNASRSEARHARSRSRWSRLTTTAETRGVTRPSDSGARSGSDGAAQEVDDLAGRRAGAEDRGDALRLELVGVVGRDRPADDDEHVVGARSRAGRRRSGAQASCARPRGSRRRPRPRPPGSPSRRSAPASGGGPCR